MAGDEDERPAGRARRRFAKKLYKLSVQCVARHYSHLARDVRCLPPTVRLDTLGVLWKNERYACLYNELKELDLILPLLRVTMEGRRCLHLCFQCVMCECIRSKKDRLSSILAQQFVDRCSPHKRNLLASQSHSTEVSSQVLSLIQQGQLLGLFLAEAGWLLEAELILFSCFHLVREASSVEGLTLALECSHRLLNVQNRYSKFNEAEETYTQAVKVVDRLQTLGVKPKLASLYSEASALHVLRSKYTEAYEWSIQALKELNPSVTLSTCIDVLRQASKTCILKRQFTKAELLIKQAVSLSIELYGKHHVKYADALIDYGYYLLNVDAISQGVEVYELALSVRESQFQGPNLLVAVTKEDVAYASYVHNYACGKFAHAKSEAEEGVNMMLELLPTDHLLLSSSKRVKALILEEMAIDSNDKEIRSRGDASEGNRN